MSSTSAIRAGRAFVEVFADTTKLETALKNIEKKFKALGEALKSAGRSMAVMGAAITAPLLGLAKAAGQTGDDLVQMSRRTGISVETLSQMGYAVGQTGATMEDFETTIKKMQNSMEKSVGGAKEATEAFSALGLSVTALRGLSPDEQFKAIAEAMSQLQSPAQRTAIAIALFGRNGTQLLPLLEQGAAGIDALTAKADALGITMSTADAVAAENFNHKLTELWQVMKKAGFDVASILLPALTSFANVSERMIASTVRWLKENKELVVWTLAVGVGLVAAGAAIYAVGTAIVSTLTFVEGLGTAFAALWGIITSGAAIVTSPIIAIAAAILYVTGAGGKALNWLGQQFAVLQDFATNTFHGIADALIAGDIETAAKILWVSLKIAWQTGVGELEKIWLNVKFYFLDVLYGLVDGAEAAWEILTDTLTKTWINAFAEIESALVKFKATYDDIIEGLGNLIANKMVDVQVLSGNITADEGEKRRGDIDKISQGNIDEIGRNKANDLNKLEADRRNQLATQEKDHNDAMAAIGKDYNDSVEALQKELDDKLKGGNSELANLWNEYNDLIAKAKGDRGSMPGANLPGAGSPPDFLPGISSAEKTFGTFSAGAARISGGGAPLDRIAEATKSTATNTKGMFDLLKNFDNSMGL